MSHFASCVLGFSILLGLVGGSYGQDQSREPSYLTMDINNLVLQQWRNGDKANRNDMCIGDKVVAWDGQPLKDNDDLIRRWLAKYAGDSSTITVERTSEVEGKPQTEKLDVQYVHEGASQFYKDCMAGGRMEFPSAATIHPEWENANIPLRATALKGLGADGPKHLDALQAAFQRFTDTVRGHYRSDEVTYLLNRPFQAEMWARSFVDPIAASSKPTELAAILWRLADPQRRPFPQTTAVTSEAKTFSEWVSELERRVTAVDAAYEESMGALAPDERKHLEKWCLSFRPIWRGDEQWKEFVEGVHITTRIDASKFASTVALSSQLLDDLIPGGAIYDGLVATASQAEPGIKKLTTIYGPGNDNAAPRTRILIDVGGNDIFLFDRRESDSVFGSQIIVDLAGNDLYIDRGSRVAAGFGGANLLIDGSGDDKYMGNDKTLGFALIGLSVLWDVAGNDTYQSEQFTQGAGCLGIGMIADQAGNDRYDAASFAQGLGLPAGCGAILDRTGDDNYLCTGRQPSPYEDAGEYAGWGQGCGWGFRSAAAGGVGLLMDCAGGDFYRSGQFGLGCGYFFGIGLVNDRAGDDVYECSRYGLASAAHYAVGIVLDDAGHDRYLALRSASLAVLASTWDLSVGMLVDSAGDDFYQAQVYALGGAAQNAYGLFWDKAGRDTYRSSGGGTEEAAGFVGGATYGGGRLARNIAVFLDEGNTEDDYRIPGRSNNATGQHGEFAVWDDH
jgi:hypothetical protein